MKTTVDIPDDLHHQLKRRAADEGVTVRELLAAAIRQYLSGQGGRSARKPFRLRDASAGNGWLAPGIREGDWEQIRDIIYEGRGA